MLMFSPRALHAAHGPRTKSALLSLRIVLAISTHSCGRPIISEAL
uniref:Uncharacterized protein n=1 Tax=Utricularia reniformis TaxID=192314 RepID=A0A1Y0AZG0_9LAMI|nr:hypothetical protein AEK19_MT0289 [Utricularia reniformis]ART30565.1 hypothetical protein AEK19_MT0289 [Utricularia reniformis]